LIPLQYASLNDSGHDATDGLLGLQELHRDNAKRVMEHIYDRYTNTQYYKNFDESGGSTKSSLNFLFLLAGFFSAVYRHFA